MAIFSQSSEQTKIDFLENTTMYFLIKQSHFNYQKYWRKLAQILKEINLNCKFYWFIIDKNDNYYFLEINPVGQYGMVADPCAMNWIN